MIRSLAFMFVFYGLTVVFVIGAVIAALFGQQPMQAVVRGWVASHRFCARWMLGIRVRVEGIVPEGQFLFAAKHQAMFETLDLLTMLDTPAFVFKKELADIPAWGWIAQKYGGIPVDRSAGAGAMRTLLRRTRAILASERSVVIFPEGTRVRPGHTPPLQAGFVGLYKVFGLPVVPVAIDSGHVWPRDSWIKRPGTVTYRFFEPIPPGLPRGEIEARVHALINDLETGRD